VVIAGPTAYYQPHGKRNAAPKPAGLCGELKVGSNIVDISDWTTSCGPLPTIAMDVLVDGCAAS
jgi:hypothetical protein